jgi:hypothetical protein
MGLWTLTNTAPRGNASCGCKFSEWESKLVSTWPDPTVPTLDEMEKFERVDVILSNHGAKSTWPCGRFIDYSDIEDARGNTINV